MFILKIFLFLFIFIKPPMNFGKFKKTKPNPKHETRDIYGKVYTIMSPHEWNSMSFDEVTWIGIFEHSNNKVKTFSFHNKNMFCECWIVTLLVVGKHVIHNQIEHFILVKNWFERSGFAFPSFGSTKQLNFPFFLFVSIKESFFFFRKKGKNLNWCRVLTTYNFRAQWNETPNQNKTSLAWNSHFIYYKFSCAKNQ